MTNNLNNQIWPSSYSIQAEIESNPRMIQAEVESRLQDIEIEISSALVYAFSPIAKVEQISDEYYKITITDKNGTTTALIPIVSSETIQNFIITYFQEHSITQLLIEETSDSQVLYQQLQNLIQGAIDVEEGLNGSIIINGQSYQVYTLPSSVLQEDDILILNCGDSTTEY